MGLPVNYYGWLGLSSSASALDIRRAYRNLSKRYHPDTTELPPDVAKEMFQQIKEAYAMLSDPQQRRAYDLQLRLERQRALRSPVTPPANAHPPISRSQPIQSSSAYSDPTDRPLSAGELFVLFILGLTFMGCLLLAIAIGLTRGEIAFQPVGNQNLDSSVDLMGSHFVQNVKVSNTDSDRIITTTAPKILKSQP